MKDGGELDAGGGGGGLIILLDGMMIAGVVLDATTGESVGLGDGSTSSLGGIFVVEAAGADIFAG